MSVRNTVETIDFEKPRAVADDHGDPMIRLQ
jgi:hypothetical protein